MKPSVVDNPKNIFRNIHSTIDSHSQETDRETENAINKILRGDLYVIGKLWIEVLKTALTGMKFNIIPVVEAAKVPETPQKPPHMKYSDLPLYNGPHYEYKDYLEDKKKCPDANVKLLHRTLLPYVKCYRQIFERNLCEVKCAVGERCHNLCDVIRRTKNDIKQNMRDPDNITIRQGIVLIGGSLGYFIGSGGGIPRRLFFTSLGFLTAGALCFPKETDEAFRGVAYSTGKLFIAVYNKWCGKEFVLRERLACNDDLPPQPPNRKPVPCPPNK